jgi:hypothetical protein
MPERRRLNSWKEIAAYAQRDVRTVTRWAKSGGLPVRRVPGLRSVFAYSDEIDAWLAGEAARDREAENAGGGPAPSRRMSWRGRPFALASAAILFLLATLAAPRLLTRPVPLVSVETHGRELVGMSAASKVAWTHRFEEPIRIFEPRADRVVLTDLDRDGTDDVVASIGTVRSVSLTGGPQDSEVVYAFSSAGRQLWSNELHDVLQFRGGRFERPWYTSVLRPFRSDGSARVIWLAHHRTWWPSIATVLDARGVRTGTFTHPGWLTNAAALDEGRIVVTGINNPLDADIVTILDAQSWPGTVPPFDGEFACVECPAGRPLKYFVLPRSELHTASHAQHLPAYVHVFPTTIEIRIQQSADQQHPAEIIFEFTRDFRVVRARPSDSYWTWHRRLETAGVLKHSAEACPERRGFAVRTWDRDRGWSEQRVGDG